MKQPECVKLQNIVNKKLEDLLNEISNISNKRFDMKSTVLDKMSSYSNTGQLVKLLAEEIS